MRGKPRGIIASTILFVTVLFVISAAAIVLIVHAEVRERAFDDAYARADLLISRNLAIHSYFNEELKPELFDVSGVYFDEDSFMPSWMSSTYAVRRITTRVDDGSAAYYYKEAAINARSPENEADRYERAFLVALNEGGTHSETSGVREVDGEPVFYLLRRGEMMEEACLRCHSTPDRAPAELVAEFGPERSFGREVGEVVSALSVHVPVEEAYANADRVARDLSVLMLGVLALVITTFYLFIERQIVKPLREATKAAIEIAADARPLESGIPVTGSREMQELGMVFNSLASSLRDRMHELEVAYQEATEANRAKDRFLGNLSHELRTPLNSIIGFSGVIGAGLAGPLTDEQKRQLDMISRSGNHLLGLLQDLLDYAKISSGRANVNSAPFLVCESVERVSEILRVEAERKGLTLQVEGCDTGVKIDSDRLKFEQILLNIMGNAVKFTENGTVNVRIEHTQEEVLVHITDTGSGIPTESSERLFEDFFQITGPDEAKPRGAGLGLSVSRSFAQLLGGDITLTSEPGVGSEFVLRLPRTAPKG